MKKLLVGLLFPFLFFNLATAADNQAYESLKLINAVDWAKLSDDFAGYLGESKGELLFSPVDAELLAKIVPKGTPLTIKRYQAGKLHLKYDPNKVPLLVKVAGRDLPKQITYLKEHKLSLVAYPGTGEMYLLVDGKAYGRVRIQAGPEEEYIPVRQMIPNRSLDWSPWLAQPTKSGDYSIFSSLTNYSASSAYPETVVPFGAWLIKSNGRWIYQDGNNWYQLPEKIAADLNRPSGERLYHYYDGSSDGGCWRWGSNDFGAYLLTWGKNKFDGYPDLGYAPGEMTYNQQMLIKDLVFLLTVPGADDFNSCVAESRDFQKFGRLFNFVQSGGKNRPSDYPADLLTCWQIYRAAELPPAEVVDARLLKACREYRDNRLPRSRQARRQALGLYHYAQRHALLIEDQARWYEKVRASWGFFAQLREKLRQDFNQMGILSPENRQNVLEGWLTDRLDFKLAVPPAEAKYVQDLTFSSFFKPNEQVSVFNEREKAMMLAAIKKTGSDEAGGLNLKAVDALNNYNFGRILNDVLGNLYRSHGCLHVSPRNSYFLYEILPLKTPIYINSYNVVPSEEAFQGIPYLSDLVNVAEDLTALKEKFAKVAKLKVEVFPALGFWVFQLDGQPFAKMYVKGGPKEKMYNVLGRDSQGRPDFEDHLAYPTTPGTYRVLRRVINYRSGTYYDLTLVPMGGLIVKENGKWYYQGNDGRYARLPASLVNDLNKPVEARDYIFYDEVKNQAGEVVSCRWGSQPFGKYCIQTTVDGVTPNPEIIHSSGDLIMEERQLVNDLINLMASPFDTYDDCVDNNSNFQLYRDCAQFVQDPSKGELIEDKAQAFYKLYYNLPLKADEVALLPLDSLAAFKVLNGQALTAAEQQALTRAKVAPSNRQKLYGLKFEAYQYVITIEKNAHHYQTVKDYWQELSGLRLAILQDFNNFVIKDQTLFNNFLRELMLDRIQLERLSQAEALKQLQGMVEQQTATVGSAEVVTP